MSLLSLARQGKSLHRHTKPKPRKPVEASKPFDVHSFAKTATDALAKSRTIKTGGAFGQSAGQKHHRKFGPRSA